MPRTRKPPPPAPEPEPIHARLRRLVDARREGRSDAEIARQAGMNAAVVSRILSGRTPDPRWSSIAAILKAVGATPRDLEKG